MSGSNFVIRSNLEKEFTCIGGYYKSRKNLLTPCTDTGRATAFELPNLNELSPFNFFKRNRSMASMLSATVKGILNTKKKRKRSGKLRRSKRDRLQRERVYNS